MGVYSVEKINLHDPNVKIWIKLSNLLKLNDFAILVAIYNRTNGIVKRSATIKFMM